MKFHHKRTPQLEMHGVTTLLYTMLTELLANLPLEESHRRTFWRMTPQE